MFTLYQISPPSFAISKISEDESYGKLKLKMNHMKSSDKSKLFCIYDGNRLMTSMINK